MTAATAPPAATPDPAAALARRWWGRPLAETRWQAEMYRLLVDPVWRGVGVPHGDGSPVILIPGFLAGDYSLTLMRRWLTRLGYRAHHARMWWNVDCSDRALDRLDRALNDVHLDAGRPVALVGHSRGGHFAKALASRRPELVSRVVSLGTGLDNPFDISVLTMAAVDAVRRGLYRRYPDARRTGCFTRGCSCRFTRDFTAPFPASVPLTSIFSRGDGVVWWEACVVPYARCVEVRGSHIGLAVNRQVYRALAHALAGEPPV